MRYLLCTLLLATAGCTTLLHDPDPKPVTSYPSDMIGESGHALLAGFTRVAPGFWDGWNGACPGADVDIEMYEVLMDQRGFSRTSYLAVDTRFSAVVAEGRRVVAGMVPGQTLVLKYSGHGGQQRSWADWNEADKQDEYLAFPRQRVYDNEIYELLCEIPAGIDVFWSNDACNSGTPFRDAEFAPDMGAIKCNVIFFGGCDDGEVSYGGEDGGFLTKAEILAYEDGMTYRQWISAIRHHETEKQRFVFREFGPRSLLDCEALAPTLRETDNE